MALHEQSLGASDEWYTPAYIFAAMGVHFALDVSGAPGRFDLPSAKACHSLYCSDSLSRSWHGPVWMNPPFGARNGIEPWLAKFMTHGCGVALTPDRTSCPWWQTFAAQADAVLFVRPKIRFISGDGHANRSPAQGTTLMAKGAFGVQALRNATKAPLLINRKAYAGLGLLMEPSQ